MPPAPPYQPPPGPLGYGNPQLQAPIQLTLARRASVALFAVAAMGLLCGVIVGAGVAIIPADQLLKGMPLQPPPDMPLSGEQLAKITYGVAAGLMVLTSILLGIFAALARRGSKSGMIAAMVLSVLVVLWLAANSVGALLGGPLAALGSTCFATIPGTPLVLAIAWLWRALQLGPSAGDAHQQYQAQYWMLQQQAGQPGQGYGYSVSPAVSAPTGPQKSMGPIPPPSGDTPPPSPG
jgi:hypothetical protein